MSGALDALADDLAEAILDRLTPQVVAAAENRRLPALAVTATEAGQALSLHPETVRKLVRAGRLQALPDTGRALRVTVASLHAYAGHPLHAQLHEPADLGQAS
jgi:excisionase family DNA binding protein